MSQFARYLLSLSQINNLGEGKKVEWLFHCGMLFLSKKKWWGDFQFRLTAHEGIDITYFRTHPFETRCFNDHTKVPAMDDGLILNICNDFLGQTLVVDHKTRAASKRKILYVYAHIIPDVTIKVGQLIRKNEIIARVCNTWKNPLLPPHLHFSCFDVPRQIQGEHLNWNLFSKNPDAHPINPVFL